MITRFTFHAKERIEQRLNGLVTTDEVEQAINSQYGQEYIDVKHFSKRIYLGDPKAEDTPKGDKITARVIYEAGTAKVITVMLRKSTSQSERYNK